MFLFLQQALPTQKGRPEQNKSKRNKEDIPQVPLPPQKGSVAIQIPPLSLTRTNLQKYNCYYFVILSKFITLTYIIS
jgi:hypothetical protein